MVAYLVRILRRDHRPLLSLQCDFAGDQAAINHAQKCAGSRPAEVWRGPTRIWREGGAHQVFQIGALKCAKVALCEGDLALAATWMAIAAEITQEAIEQET
jgi:hypothetical protein